MNNLGYFVQSIPETVGIIALSFALARVQLLWRSIFTLGMVISLIIFAVRALPVTLGIHLPVGILLIYFFLVKKTYVSISKSFLVVFASVFTLGLLELLTHELFFTLTQIDVQDAMSNDMLWTLLGIPQGILLNILAVVIAKFLKPKQGLWK